MKKSHKCPKCQSDNIVGFAAKPSIWYENENLANYLHIAPMKYLEKETYVCADCGYSEEWINELDLDIVNDYKGSKKDLTNKNKE